MSEFVVFWKNPETWDDEFEIFDEKDEAEAYLAEWAGKCPWNTYRLAEVIRTIETTQEFAPYKITGIKTTKAG
jgi:hypothetical protein